jgi:DNA-binding HxlR family transcriptional regulator
MGTVTDLRSLGGADAYLAKCPSRTVLDVISNKWVTLAACALIGGPLRFGELRRTLDGITQKMLSQTLRGLERDGLVARTVYPTVPLRVEYELTTLGRELVGLLDALRVWAERHVGEILDARDSYDERATRDPEPV